LNLSADVQNSTDKILPVVLYHGMGDTCCFSFSLGAFSKTLKHLLGDDVYVKSIRIGKNVIEDYESGYFVHPNKQVEEACRQIANDEQLRNGYNAIGFSQGGQFLRAVAQRCSSPRMNNLISLGGQHQGVFGIPSCPSLSYKACENIRLLLNSVAYSSWVQNYLVQATYWHNPLEEEEYKNYSTFIAEINNEREINEDYIRNLASLNKIVLVKFTQDSLVQPRESQWFQFYTPKQDKEIQPFEASNAAKNLRLEPLLKQNKIVFLESEGDHLQFTKEWFQRNIYPYLSGQIQERAVLCGR